MRIHAVMIVKNEEKNIRNCLLAAAPFVDAMVIADTGSSDRTKEIIREMERLPGGPAVSLYDFQWVGDFSAARNFALEKSDALGADYNLVLDADEYLLSNAYPERFRKPAGTHCDRTALEAFIERMTAQHGRAWIGCLGLFDILGDAADAAAEGGKHPAWHAEPPAPDFPRSLEIENWDVEQDFFFNPRILPAGVRYRGRVHEQPGDGSQKLIASPLRAEHFGYLPGSRKAERNLPYLEKEYQDHPEDPYVLFQLASTLGSTGKTEESLRIFRKFYAAVQNRSDSELGFRFRGVMKYLYLLLNDSNVTSLEEARRVIEAETARDVYTKSPDFWYYQGLFWLRYVSLNTEKNISFLPNIPASFAKCLQLGEENRLEGDVGTGSFKALYQLGVWFESTGDRKSAEEFYAASARMGFGPAREALQRLY